jgi:hypothetical protein
MVGRLFIGGAVLALILKVGGANADLQPEPVLVRASEPYPGGHVSLWHRSAGTAGRVDRGNGVRQSDPYPEEGSRGLEILVQHDGFIGIYSHLSMTAPAFASRAPALTANRGQHDLGQHPRACKRHLLARGRPKRTTPRTEGADAERHRRCPLCHAEPGWRRSDSYP